MDSKKEIMISDLTKCKSFNAISDRWEPGCWCKTDYELEDGTKGVMLYAEPKHNAPELKLKLNVSGKYKIFIGVNYTFHYYQFSHTNHHVEFDYGAIWLKLTKDRGFSRFGMEKYDLHAEGKYPKKVLPEKATKESFNAIYETYWKTADLSDESLIISPPKWPYNREFYRQVANISYIRLIPAEEEEFNPEYLSSAGNMAALWCTGALSGHTSGQEMYHPVERQWFENEFESFRNSDFGIFCFEAIRGNLCLFKTKKGDVGTWDKSWPSEWLDPLEEFTRLVHKEGMKMFVSLRMIGGSRLYAANPINWARYFWEHTEWGKRDKEGNLCGNLSIAFKEVRRYWLTLISEALEYGIDGIQLHFNRCLPFVMYEEPVVTSFIKEHGVDPRTLSETDERWRFHISTFVTQFLREIRELLDRKPGRELSVLIGGPEPFKLKEGYDKFEPGTVKCGCDVETWISEKLVNYLFLDHRIDTRYINYWKNMTDEDIKIYYSLMPRTQPGEYYVQLAEKLYKEGADGFCVWDCERRVHRASEWNILKHLGHRNKFERMEEKAKSYYKISRMKFHKGLNVKYSYKDG